MMDIAAIDRSINGKYAAIANIKGTIADLERQIGDCTQQIWRHEGIIDEQRKRQTGLERVGGRFSSLIGKFKQIREDEVGRFKSLASHGATSRFAAGHAGDVLNFLKNPQGDEKIAKAKKTYERVLRETEDSKQRIRSSSQEIDRLNEAIRRMQGEIARLQEQLRALSNEIYWLNRERTQAIASQYKS
jgi:chromosome segregation ATPase